MLSGQMILTSDRKMIFQTASLEQLLRVLIGEPINLNRRVPARDKLPAPILQVLRQLLGALEGRLGRPPRMQVPTAYGIITLEAKWLVPAGALPEEAAKDPKSCLISVTIELHERAIAHAAKVLRESGATSAQMNVGIQIILGKTKPAIADELGLKPSSVADLTRKLYQNSRRS